MNKRIRYIKNTDGSLKSAQYIKGATSKDEYTVVLTGNTGVVIDVATKVEHPISGSSPHKVRIAAKRMLTKLGCVFDKETRKKDSDEAGS